MDKQLPVSVWPEWKIVEKIGEGSFGKVYKAQRTVNGKVFYSAIKILTIPSNQAELNSIRSEIGDEKAARDYFKNLVDECIQEVSTMEYFRGNSYVVSVEDYKVVEYLDDIGWDIFIRMEYLTSFLDYCSGKQLKEDEVVKLGIDLCKALEYCHKINIIHRDIKPENIFVSRFGEFKIGDFGIARELERSMSGMSKKGTYSYMAPEMYRGEQYDYRVDIYSLGLVLYKLRNNNRMPFMSLEKQLITYRDKETALAKRMANEKMSAPVQASADLAKVILKACAFHREDRYDSPEEFRKDLERVAAGERVLADIDNIKDLDVAIAMALSKQSKPSKPRTQEKKERDNDLSLEEQLSEQMEKTVVHRRKSRLNIEPEHRPAVKVRAKEDSDQVQIVRAERRRHDRSQKPLWAAVIVMSVAVILLSIMFAKLMLDDFRQEKGNTVIVDDSANPQLAKDLTTIRQYATIIEADLPIYNWIGSEEYGKVTYLNQNADVMKILVYPSLSPEGVYEEYYYWNEELFFAYIWTAEESDHYYYMDDELIRWIDKGNRCHDGETGNLEYVERGKRYLEQSVKYLNEMKE